MVRHNNASQDRWYAEIFLLYVSLLPTLQSQAIVQLDSCVPSQLLLHRRHIIIASSSSTHPQPPACSVFVAMYTMSAAPSDMLLLLFRR